MTEQGEQPAAVQAPAYEPPSRNTTLIESLREQPNFLMEQYNQKLKAENQSKGIRRAGGVYVPPHKLRALQEQMLEEDVSSEGHQRMMWELLRKSINGIVNKVNIANIQNIVVQLFNENILRGRGLLARALIKAQMASPNFTHVYAALISVINTKVPEIGLLVAKRVLIQFRRSFERNNKIVCVATTRMIAHLVNQRVIGEYVALQILFIMLTTPTDDSVEIACDFMIEVGQVLTELTPAGANAIFQRFKSLLHEAEIQQKAQYSIQNLFAVRKTGFKEHPGVIAELDLVEAQDQITHQLDIEEELKGEEQLNIFKLDLNYLATEEMWERTKMDILGEENIARLKQPDQYEEQWDEEPAEQGIQDLTEQDLINLRKTIYLAIQSTVNFQECAHKIVKMNIAKGYEHELVDMILECCMMERVYQSFFGLLAERFCTIDDKFKELFITAFLNHYNNIFKQEANKIRNLAHLFSHLFHRHAVDWKVLQAIRLTPDTTTAAARMFLKIFLKDIAQNLGIDNLIKQFQKEETKEYYEGLFPIDNPNDLRFAINYYTTIGLGKLTQQMREILSMQEQIISERKRKEEEAKMALLLQEEEEMMKILLQEEDDKRKDQRKINQEDLKPRDRQREKDKHHERQDRDRGRQDRDRGRQDKDRERQDRDRGRQDRDKRRQERNDERDKDQRNRSRQKEKDQEIEDREIERKNERKKEKEIREQKDREQEKQRLKRRQQQKEREREKQQEQEHEREKEREKQRQRQKERERERQKERQKEKERQREREKEREREREREKERQKERQKQRQREKQRQKEKERAKQKTLQIGREKQQKNRDRSRQKKTDKRNKRFRSQSNESEPKKKRRDQTPKRNRRRSSSSSGNRRRARISPQRRVQQRMKSKKVVEPIRKAVDTQKRKEKNDDEDSSSGISSSSSSSSSSLIQPRQNTLKSKKVAQHVSSSSSSSDSDSSDSSSSEKQKGARRVASSSSK